MMIRNDKTEIQQYVNNWTSKTTILVCVLCFPFIVGATEILSAYVGPDYSYLGKWLQIWCVFLIVQMHSTPAFSFILANGKTRVLVVGTAIACILSIAVNALLCKKIPVGSAIIGYVVYMLCLIGVYYFILYRRYLGLKRLPIFVSFLKPLLIGVICCLVPSLINVSGLFSGLISNTRLEYIFEFVVLSLLWIVPFFCILIATRTIHLSELKK